MTFVCNVCRKVTPPSQGADDAMPDACDHCAVVAVALIDAIVDTIASLFGQDGDT